MKFFEKLKFIFKKDYKTQKKKELIKTLDQLIINHTYLLKCAIPMDQFELEFGGYEKINNLDNDYQKTYKEFRKLINEMVI
jgi:hypothetical protein